MISLFLEQYLYFTNQSNFTGQLRTPLFGKILKPQTPSLYKGGEKGGGRGGFPTMVSNFLLIFQRDFIGMD